MAWPGPDQVPERLDGGRVVGQRLARRRAGSCPARSASWRKNSAPPPSRGPSASSSARCIGVSARSSSGSGSIRSATSVGATASQPSPPASVPQPGPGHLAGAGQLVEQGRLVAGQPDGQDQRLPGARRDRRPGELLDHPEDVVGARRAPAAPADPVPGRQEASEGRRLDRLDLRAQPRERAPPDPPQHLGVAEVDATCGHGGRVLLARPPRQRRRVGRPQLAPGQAAGAGHALEHRRHHRDAQPEAPGRRPRPGTARGSGRSGRAGRPAGRRPAR